ncbi:10716_t:CDS:1, partial [Funneliformis caledonium]
SQEGLAELSSSDVLQNINCLYKNACTIENERVKANQAEILCWRNFIIGLNNSINKTRETGTVVKSRAINHV